MGMSANVEARHSLCDDAELVELARAGDEIAVRVLIRRHNQRLFRLARAVVRDDAEAEDVVQETYVRAFTSLAGFRSDAAFGTWLTRIALNEAIGRMRRRRPSVDLEDVESGSARESGELIMFPTIPGRGNPESETGRAQFRQMLEQAVDELPEPFRLVFIFRDIEGLSTAETADHLAIRAVTVKTRLHRARRLLRRKLEHRISPAFAGIYPFAGTRCAAMADRVIAALQRHRDTPA